MALFSGSDQDPEEFSDFNGDAALGLPDRASESGIVHILCH
jgi:hypothetical protein